MIAWKSVKLGISLLTNNIYIGKTKIDKNGLETWVDRSDDKTQDVLKVILDWFIIRHKYDKKDSIDIEFQGKRYTLKLIVDDIE